MVTSRFFFSSLLLHFLHLPYLFIFSITPYSLYKNLSFLFLFLTISDSPNLSKSLISLFSPFLSSSPLMAPKAKKSSQVLFVDAFCRTRWSGATRLVGPPPSTYLLENHIPMGEFVSFLFFFSHFQAPL